MSAMEVHALLKTKLNKYAKAHNNCWVLRRRCKAYNPRLFLQNQENSTTNVFVGFSLLFEGNA